MKYFGFGSLFLYSSPYSNVPWSSHVFLVTDDPSLFRPNTLKQPCLKPIPLKFLSRPIKTLARLDFPTPKNAININLF